MALADSRDPTLAQRLVPLELMIFDVDGILTDGALYYASDGEVVKAFHVLDGQGLKWLRSGGIITAIVSGRTSPIVMHRAAELGIEHVVQGVVEKCSAVDALLHDLGKSNRVTGFMGDDVMDIPVMRRVGFSATVPHAADTVAAYAHWVSARAGGQGAVREVCELILGAQGKLQACMAPFLE